MAPWACTEPGLQARPEEANLADSWQQAADGFLFLRIWGFEGLLPSRPPLHRELCGASQAWSQISSPELSGFQRDREASRLRRHPLDLVN